jgi:hypothetical protein
MDDELIRRTELYLAKNGMHITDELGDGLHGIVLLVEDNLNGGATALKVHRYAEAYQREVLVYRHFNENGIFKIRGHNVPLMLRNSDEFLAIEMTTVRRPFLLDFAGAYLDGNEPQFTPEAWAQWEEDKKEMFGENWAATKKILQSLRAHGVHMIDVNPGNIGFEMGDR